MQLSTCAVVLVLVAMCQVATAFPLSGLSGPQPGGGGNCAACTIIVGLMEQMSLIHNVTTEKLMNDICGYFPISPIKDACDYLVKMYGIQIIEYVDNHETADEVCHHLDICTYPVATCHLFPLPADRPPMEFPRSAARSAVAQISSLLGENPLEWIKNLINRFANDHMPIKDLDGDRFSTIPELRGYSWRGEDCHDEMKDVYPGRSNTTHPPSIDHNCNGILGTDNQGRSYEDLLCKNTGQIGVIVIGDSVGAHFEIPPSYMTAADINATTYKQQPDAWFRLANEFDIPEKSWGTGFLMSTLNEPVSSLYEMIRARNLCSHRDFQNTGVNGARSGAVADSLDTDLARNPATDHPVLVIYELVGNDVCNGHHTLNTMTTVPEFRQNVLKSLKYLDTVLPAGSHIMFIGLADGRILYDSLHNRTHPVGVTYSAVYDFLNCLELSPCWVWMNTNQTVRDAGTARAVELSAVYDEIIGNYTFNNFDMVYYDFPFAQILAKWQQQGGEAWQLIEPVDGFHPNQIANALMAQALYEALEQDHPEFLGGVNPNNAQITKLFGDQGGYGKYYNGQ